MDTNKKGSPNRRTVATVGGSTLASTAAGTKAATGQSRPGTLGAPDKSKQLEEIKQKDDEDSDYSDFIDEDIP